MQDREAEPRQGRRIAVQFTYLEAGTLLLLARLLLTFIPFPRLMRLLSRPMRRAEVQGSERLRQHKVVRHAIFTMRQRLHHTTCLHRAIAAQLMLQRRGLNTTLYFGAATLPTKGFTSHAWVQDGDVGIVGFQTAQRDNYYVVATFPEIGKSTSLLQRIGDSHG